METCATNTARPTRVLTVGDGDLTLSLSLARAYGDRLSLTASVLDGRDGLLLAYPDAPIKELEERNVTIHYGLDATQLHCGGGGGTKGGTTTTSGAFPEKDEDDCRPWDLILFHHPHLGLASLEKDEAEHANRHFRLLCHYLYSAGLVSPLAHVCLCGTQPQTWKLLEAAELVGMELVQRLPTTVPISRIWTESHVPVAPVTPQFAAPRRYRNGKLGSRHFLGKYGYRHRRTEGCQYKGASSDMNVTGSEHFVLQRKKYRDFGPQHISLSSQLEAVTCRICNGIFSSESDLESHMEAPSRPRQNFVSNDMTVGGKLIRGYGKFSSSNGGDKFQNSSLSTTSNSLVCIPSKAPPVDGRTPHDMEGGKSASESILGDADGSSEYQQLIVSKEHTGKRLRWFVQHKIKDFSKRRAENSIRLGMVCINGATAKDSSRILVTGNTVSISIKKAREGEESKDHQRVTVDILYRSAPYLAAWKPTGLRTKGAFPGTLESALSIQEGGIEYVSLSSFETSCPGICVMTNKNQERKTSSNDDKGGNNVPFDHNITHVLIALVHGQVPNEWLTPINVCMKLKSKWRRSSNKKRSYNGKSVAKDCGKKETIQIFCKEKMISNREFSVLSLSTISIRAKTPSTSSICQYLRHAGYPVVGDVYCQQEYLQLKRSIRNRIKGKLCIGCYSIEINSSVVATKVIPSKLSAWYWEEHVLNNDQHQRAEESKKHDT